MVYMYENGRLHSDEDFWNDPDEIIEVRRSNLQRTRNAHLLIGGTLGVAATLFIEFIYLWVRGVF